MLTQAIANPVYEVNGALVCAAVNLGSNIFEALNLRRLAAPKAEMSFDPNVRSGDIAKQLRNSLEMPFRDALTTNLFSTLDAQVQTIATMWGETKFPHVSREQLLYYGEGMYSNLHIDDQHRAPVKQGATKYVMHLLNQLAAILYVTSSDLVGGDIEFPEQQKRFSPTTGMLLVYPSNYKFPHKVYPVVLGHRFAFARHYYFYDTPTA